MNEKYLIEKPSDVLQVIQKFKDTEAQLTFYELELHCANSVELFDMRIDQACNAVMNGGIDAIRDWKSWFREMGKITLDIMHEWCPKFESAQFASFLLGKHRAYTVAPLLRWKQVGILMRLTSKIERYKNVMGSAGLAVGEESPTKNVEDMLGYCVLGYLLTERLKEE